jgi:uncharacterized protein (DUF1330 family)
VPAYWVNTYRSVSDPDKQAAYAELAGKVMAEHGGRFLARGTAAHAFESGVVGRTIVIVFPDVATALAAYESEGYQEALRVLGDGAERDLRIVDGVTPPGDQPS